MSRRIFKILRKSGADGVVRIAIEGDFQDRRVLWLLAGKHGENVKLCPGSADRMGQLKALHFRLVLQGQRLVGAIAQSQSQGVNAVTDAEG